MSASGWSGSYELTGQEPDAIAFHKLWYESGICARMTWRGVPIGKCPMDLMMFQELLWRVRPRTIIETGTNFGGSALFLADMLRLVEEQTPPPWGRVITIDAFARPVSQPEYLRPKDGRIVYITGDSASPDVAREAFDLCAGDNPTMVFLDSRHEAEHVLKELALYAPRVSVGSYLVVEDSNVSGHPVVPDFGPGPTEALNVFLAMEPEGTWEVDRTCERLGLTMQPGGFLRRLK